MSFNPPPVALPGEAVLVEQGDVEFHVAIPGIGTFKARGLLRLSNVRILFVADKPSFSHGQSFASFDVPIRAITAASFNQPIFGANNLSGKTHPISCLGVSEELAWTCYLMSGGAALVPVFLRLMDRVRIEQQQQQSRPPPPVMAQPMMAVGQEQAAGIPVATPAFAATAYVDPSDTSKLYAVESDPPNASAPPPPER